MALMRDKSNNAGTIIEGRFISRSLEEAGQDILQEQNKRMSSFKSDFWDNKKFTVTDNQLDIEIAIQQRFVDMKTRETKEGKITKKSYPVYNKVIFGKYNNLVRRLAFGLTDEVKQDLRQLND